ncbi:MAG: MBL fold metallo-hydrolase [Acidimicrobiales bacterium]|jgi:L-ascorbate 6-phosphate lactonase
MDTPGSLWQEIETTRVRAGTLVLWWLYQAGVVFKSSGGTIVAVDPYLSDSVTRSYGIARNVPAPLNPAEADLNALVATHSHEDHLDPDSIAAFLSHDRTAFVGPPMAVEKVVESGAKPSRTVAVSRGDRLEIGDMSIRAVHARHFFGPEPTPDAVGFVLEADGLSVYHSGDTEYDREIVTDTRGVTVSLICMNGTNGNMNAYEAALLAWLQGPRLAIPFHYGLWSDADYGEDATLDPRLFVATYNRLRPEGRTLVLVDTSAVTLSADGLARQPL